MIRDLLRTTNRTLTVGWKLSLMYLLVIGWLIHSILFLIGGSDSAFDL